MKTITAREFAKILKAPPENVIFVDIRPACEFNSLHLEGTQNMPADGVDKNLDLLKAYDQVYINCSSGVRSEKICCKLEQVGINNVINVAGGLQACVQVGCCLGKAINKAKTDSPRKYNLYAGSGILLGVILGHFASPFFLLLPVIIALLLICWRTKR